LEKVEVDKFGFAEPLVGSYVWWGKEETVELRSTGQPGRLRPHPSIGQAPERLDPRTMRA
jgi:hypothetical protein